MQLKKIKRVLLLFFLVWNEVWGSVIALNISSGGVDGAADVADDGGDVCGCCGGVVPCVVHEPTTT